MSTHAFARALAAGGHDVMSLVRSFEHPRRDRVHEQLVDASVKSPAALARAILTIDSVLGRRAHIVPGHGHPVWASPYPEHALPRLLRLFEPEVVVGNSIDRVSWRRCAALARRAGARTVLHLREATAIGHLTISHEIPDVLLANAESLAESAGSTGFRAFVVPSVVELDRSDTVESTSQVALFVSPQADFGFDIALRLAARRSDVSFVLDRSSPFDDDFSLLERRAAGLSNVELRRRRQAPDFADARVLVVADLRVDSLCLVWQAQHMGVPVVATDLLSLREAVGEGGLAVPVGALEEQWQDAFDQAWADPLGAFGERARAHAARPEVQSAAAAAAFESAMTNAGKMRPRPSSAPPSRPLGLTVVVPAHNAEQTIGEQLDALLSQQWAPGFEVIVADNLSTDGTAEVVRSRMLPDDCLRLVVAGDGRSAASARTTGAAAARSESIAFCDADDVVSPNWVAAMGEALRRHSLVAGKLDVQTLNPPGLDRSRGLAIAEGPGNFGPIPFAHGCNMGIRKTVLDTVGGWDGSVRTGEDIELCLRLWNSGVQLHYEPSAEIYYRYRSNEASPWRQAIRYGEAHVDLARRLDVRQVAGTRRLHGWRNLAWLVRHWPDVLNRGRRPHWLWTAGLSAGHIRGSFRWRIVYL